MERLASFGRLLRELGIDVGPGDVAAAARGLAFVRPADRDAFYLTLRTVLCRKVEDFPLFHAAFVHFWLGGDRTASDVPDGAGIRIRLRRTGSPEGVLREAGGPDGEEGPGDGDGGLEEGQGIPGYTARVLLLRKDLAKLEPHESPEVARLARELARRLARRVARRLRRHWRGAIDPARTLRRALRTGGEVLELRRRRRRQKARLVALLDVSGSMQPYSRFLLVFLAALTAQLPATETFVFSTELVRVTRELRARELEAVAAAAPDWAGGTRLGASLECFVREHAPLLVDRRTALLVLSDGLDTGETERVEDAMRRLRGSAGRIVWLNPLAGDPAYEPLQRGMRAALPFVDVLAPAHSLESLLALPAHLG
ncbi:vWA domain-containing protein [Caldinitratiruptor microaerophilus]|uniref:VWA domain-containing protein n=1 Tax=Caldinitratiruptor microaerophilus TaxID=671077 RepID=A0AA35CKX5_9FIRM|nr:VWA domain-containing protein [Caldinitratiruptor microaerophilus]BDG61200.1 VWA domain-containing protein [Caldinitratiruptor microaerophilus]